MYVHKDIGGIQRLGIGHIVYFYANIYAEGIEKVFEHLYRLNTKYII